MSLSLALAGIHVEQQAEQHEQLGKAFHALHDVQHRRQVDRVQQPRRSDKQSQPIAALPLT